MGEGGGVGAAEVEGVPPAVGDAEGVGVFEGGAHT